jgi:ketosteroid isomerase-like protein
MSSKDIVREFIVRVNDAMKGGRMDPFELLDEEVRVLINGTTPLSGNYPNLQIVRNVLLCTTKRRIKSASISLIDCIGTGKRVGTLLKITAQTVDNRTYNEAGDPAGCLFGVQDGKISEIHLFPDTTLIETVIFNREFVPN